MLSTLNEVPENHPVETYDVVHIACGGESPMNSGILESYPQSTGPTTTTTLYSY